MPEKLDKAVGDKPSTDRLKLTAAETPGDTVVSDPKAGAKRKPQKASDNLLFDAPRGVDVGKVFNTFRVGDKWNDRVQAGDTVTLATKTEDGEEPFGEAEVLDIVVGNWDGVKGLASDNHAFGNGVFSSAEGEAMLDGELRRLYPDYKGKGKLTVLYLKRTK